MTDKTTPSTESDGGRDAAHGRFRRSAARARAGAQGRRRCGRAGRPRAVADEPAAQLRRRVAEREDAARQETAAVLADIARRTRPPAPARRRRAARGDRGAVAG